MPEIQPTFNNRVNTIIHGIVSAAGVSSIKSLQSSDWKLSFELIAWQTKNGPVHKESLHVTQNTTKQAVLILQEAIRPDSIVSLAVEQNDSRAILKNVINYTYSGELVSILDDYQKPIVLDDEILGRLELNRQLNWFEGSLDCSEYTVFIALSPDESGLHHSSIKNARRLKAELQEWLDSFAEFAASNLLHLKNSAWLKEGDIDISKEEFLARIQLQEVIAYPDSKLELWFEDGDLFWGHSIMVAGSMELGPVRADIAG